MRLWCDVRCGRLGFGLLRIQQLRQFDPIERSATFAVHTSEIDVHVLHIEHAVWAQNGVVTKVWFIGRTYKRSVRPKEVNIADGGLGFPVVKVDDVMMFCPSVTVLCPITT